MYIENTVIYYAAILSLIGLNIWLAIKIQKKLYMAENITKNDISENVLAAAAATSDENVAAKYEDVYFYLTSFGPFGNVTENPTSITLHELSEEDKF